MSIATNIGNALGDKKFPKFKIFVLNTAEDKQEAAEIITMLREKGFLCWDGILPGEDHNAEQEKALFEADIVLAMMSKNSAVTVGRYSALLKTALSAQMELPEGVIKFIPMLIDGAELPYEFQKYRALDMRDEDAANLVAKSFERRAKTKIIKEKRSKARWS